MHQDAYGEMIGTVCITKWMKRSHNGMAWMSVFRSGDVLLAVVVNGRPSCGLSTKKATCLVKDMFQQGAVPVTKYVQISLLI